MLLIGYLKTTTTFVVGTIKKKKLSDGSSKRKVFIKIRISLATSYNNIPFLKIINYIPNI